MEVNQYNAAGQSHGYCKIQRDGERQYYKCHHFNGKLIGCDEWCDIAGYFRTHWNGNHRVGCEERFNSQYFYKAPEKKFGEEIKWK